LIVRSAALIELAQANRKTRAKFPRDNAKAESGVFESVIDLSSFCACWLAIVIARLAFDELAIRIALSNAPIVYVKHGLNSLVDGKNVFHQRRKGAASLSARSLQFFR
jgi:hypothetical protein